MKWVVTIIKTPTLPDATVESSTTHVVIAHLIRKRTTMIADRVTVETGITCLKRDKTATDFDNNTLFRQYKIY